MNNGPDIPSLLSALWHSSLELDKSEDRDKDYLKNHHEVGKHLCDFPTNTSKYDFCTASKIWTLYASCFNLQTKNRQETVLVRKTVCLLAQIIFEMNRVQQNFSDVIFAQPCSFGQCPPPSSPLAGQDNSTQDPPPKRLKMSKD